MSTGRRSAPGLPPVQHRVRSGASASSCRRTRGAHQLAKHGQIAFARGQFRFKGLRLGTGQADVKAYNRQLCDLIAADRAKPAFLVSHESPLGQAPEADRHFDNRDDGWIKVVLEPGQSG